MDLRKRRGNKTVKKGKKTTSEDIFESTEKCEKETQE